MVRALSVGAALAACLADLPGVASPAIADDGTRLKPTFEVEVPVDMKTLGGRQFWGDVAFFHGWRIQQNVFTGHHRLLDGNDYRHASGTLEDCRTRLVEIRARDKLEPMSGKAVICVHGIFRSSKSFGRLKARLEREGYHVFGFDYPSTQISIADAAGYLASCIDSLSGIEEINFVVHSMGGLVVRAYLKEHCDSRIQRMVMMGVPNLGAHMADNLSDVKLYHALFGPAGQELATDPAGFIAALPTPDFEFGILAGARGTPGGYNPLVPGDDDGTVAVSSTRLPGAADFITVPSLHSFLMNHDESIEATVNFLATGRFRQQGEPQPIPREAR